MEEDDRSSPAAAAFFAALGCENAASVSIQGAGPEGTIEEAPQELTLYKAERPALARSDAGPWHCRPCILGGQEGKDREMRRTQPEGGEVQERKPRLGSGENNRTRGSGRANAESEKSRANCGDKTLRQSIRKDRGSLVWHSL